MRRLTIALMFLLTGSLVYCDDPTGILGELGFGIISGQNQTVTAGSSELGEPVVGRLVEDGSGNVSFLIGPQPLLAQTVVKGIPGQVVCDKATTEPYLEPFSVCATTDANGFATFHYSAGTKAGEARHEIRCECPEGALVTDTVVATVKAAAVTQYPFGIRAAGDTANLGGTLLGFSHNAFGDRYGNAVPIRLEGTDWIRPQGDTIGTQAARILLPPDSTVAVGDTATFRVMRESGPVLDALATLQVHPKENADGYWSIHLLIRDLH